MQATGGIGQVELSWIQDEFDLLHGYNVYCSLDADGYFTRINSVVIPARTNTYTDSDVAPGVDHYYRFKVVSDRGESDFSNTALGTPQDTVPPVINHTPVLDTAAGFNRTLSPTVTDNIGVQSATFFYRLVGAEEYTARPSILMRTPCRTSKNSC